MALSRRTGQRFQGSIWPGFVDAMTGLLLVLMFVLTIFMVVQFVLRETISGQETELDSLSAEVAALARSLGLSESRASALQGEVGELKATLTSAEDEADRQRALIASLRIERDSIQSDLVTARTGIASFEAQVASLIAQRDNAKEQVETLEANQGRLLSEQERLEAALSQLENRSTEQAQQNASLLERLASLQTDIENQRSRSAEEIAALVSQVENLETTLSEEEQRQLTEAALAEELRARLENSQAELTAMSMLLEEQRQKAEETLTLLAAAEKAGDDLNARLAATLLQRDNNAAQITALQNEIDANRAAAQDTTGALSSVEAALALALLQLEEAEALANRRADEIVQLQTEVQEVESTLTEEKLLLSERLALELEVVQQDRASLETQARSLEQQLVEAIAARAVTDSEITDLQDRLAAMVAAKIAAEQMAEQTLSEADQRALLLSQANSELANEKERSAQARREAALLNQQLEQIRLQMQQLNATLGEYETREDDLEAEIVNLGSRVNEAMARLAQELRRREVVEAQLFEKEQAERQRLEREAQTLKETQSEFLKELKDLFEGQDGVRIVGDRFVFSSEVLFPPGGAQLSRTGRAEIAKIAGTLRNIAGDIPPHIDWVIRVDGHTDNKPLSGRGEFRDNWELSQARSLSVVKYMVNFLGIPPDRLSANGFGQYQPITKADTDEARAQNRRIELKFTEK